MKSSPVAQHSTAAQRAGTDRGEALVHPRAEQGPAREVLALLEGLGRALHQFGAPAHRLEDAMAAVSRRLGIDAQFFSTPTAIFMSHPVDGRQETSLVRVEPGEVHLEKLSRLDEILETLAVENLEPAAATAAVQAVVEAPPRYPAWAEVLAFGLASGAAARFFSGGPNEILGACGAGVLTGLLARAVTSRPNARRLFEIVAAALVALCASLMAATTGASAYVITVAGLIALLPGLSLTIAMTELATRNLVSGSARLAGAVLIFITLGFGVALGTRLGHLVGGLSAARPSGSLAPWTELPFLAIAALSFTILFRARPRDLGWILLGGTFAFYSSRFGAELFGPELGAFFGAVVVGISGNFFARGLRRPAAIIEVPALMLLVPGSLGFRGVSSFLARDTVLGIEAAFTVLLVATALVAGLLVANVVLPPRRAL